GIDDPFNEQQDYFLSLLQERNVPFLDLRQEMLRDHINWDTAFYRTDHHWTVETAFWAWTKTLPVLADMVPGLREKQEFLTDINQYETAIVTNKWVGSMGRRIGSFYAGTEVLSYYRPRFKTNFKVTKLSASGNPLSEKNGHFEQSIYNGWEAYGSCLPGTQSDIINEKGTGDVLLIGDSYAIPFCAYAAQHLRRITHIDPRDFTGSLPLFLQKNRYDCVIVMLTPRVLYFADPFVQQVRQELREVKPD
ncbi:MAG: hypothetical protein LBH00_12710, partial [Planctomycetaceae bacterium]|nr:hypothetical protein [Planctomycetaceae bacterium]